MQIFPLISSFTMKSQKPFKIAVMSNRRIIAMYFRQSNKKMKTKSKVWIMKAYQDIIQKTVKLTLLESVIYFKKWMMKKGNNRPFHTANPKMNRIKVSISLNKLNKTNKVTCNRMSFWPARKISLKKPLSSIIHKTSLISFIQLLMLNNMQKFTHSWNSFMTHLNNH